VLKITVAGTKHTHYFLIAIQGLSCIYEKLPTATILGVNCTIIGTKSYISWKAQMFCSKNVFFLRHSKLPQESLYAQRSNFDEQV